MKCVLASVLRILLWTGLNNLYWAVSKMIAVTPYSVDSKASDCSSLNFGREIENSAVLIL